MKLLAISRFMQTKSHLCRLAFRSNSTASSTNLKDRLCELVPEKRAEVQEFKKEYGDAKIGEVTVNMAYGGMRGIKGLVTETSVLDPVEGIRFRGYSIPECQKLLPTAVDGGEPLPEGLFWLLMTGEIPTKEQTTAISRELASRAELPQHVVMMLNNFPENLHPMSQFSAALTALNNQSKFAKAYSDGAKKTDYWEYVYEDAMDLLAKLPVLAAVIYRNVYKDGQVAPLNPDADWSLNLSTMLGYDDPTFVELMRLYLMLHTDHEGGNVSAHTCHLVGSALSDPYLSYAAALNGLAGPLHGLANQEVLLFVMKLVDDIGYDISKQQIEDYCLKTLETGVIPGYGHAVLRKTDPRYTCQREFALKYMPEDPLFKVVSLLYDVVPDLLGKLGKVQNPWPNVDAHSGVNLQHFGLTEMGFYTVLFGVSRAMGCMSSLLWDRAFALPIERPKSMSTPGLKKLLVK